jgi:hypothetical protein
MSENETLIATADADTNIGDIPVVGNEINETTTVEVGGDVDRISVSASAEDAGSPDEPRLEMPDKFANAEDPQAALLKAYKELEKQRTGTKEPEVEPTVEPAAEEAEEGSERQKAEKVEEYSQLWAKQDGSLTDDQWSKVSSDLGVSIDDLKSYEAYRKDVISNTSNSNDELIYKTAGGEDAYNKMIDWASSTMNDAQLSALNAQLDNPQFSEMGMNMLKSMYTNTVGFEAGSSTLDKAAQSGQLSETYHSEQEVLEAQRHPDYGKGGKYDMEFDRKLLSYMRMKKQI